MSSPPLDFSVLDPDPRELLPASRGALCCRCNEEVHASGEAWAYGSTVVAIADSAFEVLEDYATHAQTFLNSVALLGTNGVSDQVERQERTLAYASGRVPRCGEVCIECYERVVELADQRLVEQQQRLAPYQATMRKLQAVEQEDDPEEQEQVAGRLAQEIQDMTSSLALLDAELASLTVQEKCLRAQFQPDGLLGAATTAAADRANALEAALTTHANVCALRCHEIRDVSWSAEALGGLRIFGRIHEVTIQGDDMRINGLRISLSPEGSEDGVQSGEIGDAWGAAALLLFSARKVLERRPRARVELDGVRIVPLGAASRLMVGNGDGATVHPLFWESTAPGEGPEAAVLLFCKVLEEATANAAQQFPVEAFGDDLQIAIEEVELASSEAGGLGVKDLAVAKRDLLVQGVRGLRWLTRTLP